MENKYKPARWTRIGPKLWKQLERIAFQRSLEAGKRISCAQLLEEGARLLVAKEKEGK